MTLEALRGRRILVGITGGIAAYKSAELVRRLRGAGAQTRVAMTAAAQHFIAPLTLQALSEQPVALQLFDAQEEAAMGHITLARWAERVLVAPASADFLAQLAGGHAEELLSTLCLASTAPLLVAPAMNRVMWEHPATRANCELLASRGVQLVGPAWGEQACGEWGAGRMVEVEELLRALAASFGGTQLAGLRVVITAGPTRENIDPVRFISNRSSGRMGFALARAAQEAGADTVLISGPVALREAPGVRRVDVQSAAEMYAAALEEAPQCAIFIAVAAVADYRPEESAARKEDKGGRRSLGLVPTPDIAAAVAALEEGPFTVGFAAETGDLLERARQKRQRKGLDMIVANDVAQEGIGFESKDNAVTVIGRDSEEVLQRMPKEQLAGCLLKAILAERERLHAAPKELAEGAP